MKKMINRSHIEGLIYESSLEEQTAGVNAKNPGSKYISGTISVEISESNIVPVSVFEAEFTQAGATNKKYANMKNLISIPTVVKDGKEKATKIRIDSALALNDWYRPDGELISTLRNFNGFFHIVTDNKYTPSATFDTDIFITSVSDDMAKNEDGDMEPTGYLVVNGFIFDFMNRIMPVKYIVEDPKGIEYFRNIEPRTFTRVWGKIVTQNIITKRVEESAFGEDKIVEFINSRRKYIIIGALSTPYEIETDETLKVSEVQDALAARNVALAALKAKNEQNKNKNTANTPSITQNKNQEFNF